MFQLASLSKPIATTVLAALVEKGTIRWDDLVVDHDPGFTLSDRNLTKMLTLRDLLCHRSGLPDHAGDLLEDVGFDRAKSCSGFDICLWEIDFEQSLRTRISAFRKPRLRRPSRRGNRGRN